MMGRPVWTMGFEPGLCSVAAPCDLSGCALSANAWMSFAHWFSLKSQREEEQMRDIALDVHLDFCEVAIAEAGEVRSAGRISTKPDELELFAQSLDARDRVALELTGNAWAIERIIEPQVAEVVVVSPTDTGIRGHGRRPTGLMPARWPGCWRRGSSTGSGCPIARPR
jgi:hypothetical protein